MIFEGTLMYSLCTPYPIYSRMVVCLSGYLGSYIGDIYLYMGIMEASSSLLRHDYTDLMEAVPWSLIVAGNALCAQV